MLLYVTVTLTKTTRFASGTAGPLRRPGTIDCGTGGQISCGFVLGTLCNRRTLSEKPGLDVSNVSNQPGAGFYLYGLCRLW